MAVKIELYNNNMQYLETIQVKVVSDYLMYRGRLFKLKDGEYIQVEYLEIY